MSESSNPQPALGAAIRGLREKRGLTQEALARGAGITVAHLSKLERGRGNPTWATVLAISEALNLSIVEIARRFEKLR